jgi:hypothetical protein
MESVYHSFRQLERGGCDLEEEYLGADLLKVSVSELKR